MKARVLVKCRHCRRPVKPFNFRGRGLAKKVLPYCRVCGCYVFTQFHKMILAALAVAILAAWVMRVF